MASNGASAGGGAGAGGAASGSPPAVRNRPTRGANGRFVKARRTAVARTVAAADDASASGKVTAKVEEQESPVRPANDTARPANDNARPANDTRLPADDNARPVQDIVPPAKDVTDATRDPKETIRSQNGANPVTGPLSGDKTRSGHGGSQAAVPAWEREADVVAPTPGSPEEVSVDGRRSVGRWSQDQPGSDAERCGQPSTSAARRHDRVTLCA